MSLLEELMGALSSQEVDAMASKAGADKNQVNTAVQAALPMLLGALNRNSNNDQQAANLAGALEKDHDGGILDNLMGFLNQGPSSRDMRIPDHIFGSKRGAVEQQIGKTSGLGSGSVQQILGMLAPIVMGALGKQKRHQGLDPMQLSNLLTNETERARQTNRSGMNMVEQFLDSDGDGDITDDVMNIGGSLLGGLFNKRR